MKQTWREPRDPYHDHDFLSKLTKEQGQNGTALRCSECQVKHASLICDSCEQVLCGTCNISLFLSFV